MSGRRVLVGLFVVMLPLVSPKIRASDEIQYFAHLRSLVFDHDLDFGNEYQHFYESNRPGLAGFRDTFLSDPCPPSRETPCREPRTGRHINFTPIGCALLWSPFFLLAHAGVVLARALGAGVVADGFSIPYQAAACYASALYGFLGLLLIHDALRRFAGVADGPATATVAALWWGTPVLYYMTLAAAFAHSSALFAVALLLWLSLRAASRGAWSLWESATIGLAGGLAALVYEKELLNLVVPGLLLLAATLRTRRFAQGTAAAGAMAVGAAIAFLPQVFAYKSVNGTYGPSSLVRRKMIYTSPHLFEVLTDPAHGLLFWAPLLAVALAGLIFWAVGRRDVLGAALVAALGMQIWICGAVDSWHQAGAFGSRRFVSSTAVLAFGLSAVVAALWRSWGRSATASVLAVFVWWNVSLMIQFGLNLMDRQKGLEWPRVAQNQVVEVPRRIGRVAFLFFTDRERLVRESR